MTADKCFACSVEINSTIRGLCAHAAISEVFVNDKCYLRYDTLNFIGKLDDATELYRIIGENATDPAAFSSAIKELFSNLSPKVGESPIMYASGFTSEYSKKTKIYGLIQCIRDISSKDCKAGLARGIADLLMRVEADLLLEVWVGLEVAWQFMQHSLSLLLHCCLHNDPHHQCRLHHYPHHRNQQVHLHQVLVILTYFGFSFYRSGGLIRLSLYIIH